MALYRSAFYWFCVLFAVSVLGFWRPYFSILGSDDVHVTHHAHGITMLLWVALLITQSWLIRTRRNPMHRTLGKVSFILAPLIVVTAVWVNVHSMQGIEAPFPDELVSIGWAPTFYQVTLVPLAIGLWLLFLDWRKGAPLRPYLLFNGLWLGNLVMWELAPRMDVWHGLLAWAAGG